MKPGLSTRDRRLLYTHEHAVEDGIDLELARIGAELTISVPNVQLSRCLLDRTRLENAPAIRVTNSSLETIDAANANLESSTWLRSAIAGSRFTGAKLNNAYLKDVTLEGCTMRLAQIQHIRGERLRFEHCDLRGAFFNGSEIPGVVFEACDLSGADFSGASIEGADLRRSRIEDIRVAPEQLRSVIVSSDQAIYLARLIGLDVRE